MQPAFSLQPFDIVTVPYRDLDGSMKRNPDNTMQFGLFMVLCVYKDDTFLGVKITSNERYVNNYSVPLPVSGHPFLKVDSYLVLTKVQPFFVSSSRKVGSVNLSQRRKVASLFNALVYDWKNGLYAYAPAYRSPNLKGDFNHD